MVVWTPRARADLKDIYDYVAKGSRQNAQRVAREILTKANILAESPHLGRQVPKVNDPELREMPAYSWRIIYHLRNGVVYIVALIHKRRQPATEDLLPPTIHEPREVYGGSVAAE